MRIELPGPIDVREFRVQANSMLARQVAPAEIEWHPLPEVASGIAFRGDGGGKPARSSALQSIVPRSFVRLTSLVVLHRDPCRFALLYRLLWRLVHEPELAGSRGDAELAQARAMAQSVRRDVAQCKLSTRLRPLAPEAGVTLSLGWCEPHHQVTEHLAEWLAVRVPQPPWLLASPDRCVLWTGRHLLCGPGVAAQEAAMLRDAHWHARAAGLARRAS
jgi:probable DNA metabolism protein